MARLEKILGGLRNLTMVDEEAWNTYGQTSTTILQTAEDGLDEVPFMFNHPGSNALALKLEEAVLAMGEGARETPMSEWHGRGIAVADDGSLAAAGQPLRYGGGLITTARPQWVNRNGTPAVGLTDEAPCALKRSQRTHGVASAMRLRGGGPNEGPNDGDERRRAGKRPWEGVEGAWGRPRETGHQGDEQLNGWGRPKQRQQHDAPLNPREPPSLPRQVDDQPNGWGRMLTSTNGHLHHVREWQDQATWGVVENSWRGGLLDEKGGYGTDGAMWRTRSWRTLAGAESGAASHAPQIMETNQTRLAKSRSQFQSQFPAFRMACDHQSLSRSALVYGLVVWRSSTSSRMPPPSGANAGTGGGNGRSIWFGRGGAGGFRCIGAQAFGRGLAKPWGEGHVRILHDPLP